MSKYHNRRSTDGVRMYDSGLERDRACELQLLVKAGAISDLEYQPKVSLSDAGIDYKADFLYMQDGRPVWEDVKGVVTDRFRMIMKLWRVYGPGLLRITKRDKRTGKIRTVKEIMPR